MYIRGKGVSFPRVKELIEKVSAEKYEGNIELHRDARAINGDYGFQGRIIGRVTDGIGTRRSASGRRGRNACWHSYRDILIAVFNEYPHAVVTTALSRYEGIDGFNANYPQTAHHNVGSPAFPAYMPDLCDCED